MQQPPQGGPPLSDPTHSQPTTSQLMPIEQANRKPTGIRSGTHGITYQLNLLMLFIIRAEKHGHEISLGTEVPEADKFDDVVISYHKENLGKVYRFLQAKHRQNDSKRIKANHLLNASDEDFSILKYFISYRKIKQNAKFDGEPKDFIICTNIDVDNDVLRSLEEVDTSNDELFRHETYIGAKQYKFKKGSILYDKLVSMFKTNHFERLAAIVARLVGANKLEKDNLILCYRGWLLDNVFMLESANNKLYVKFHDKILHEHCEGDLFLQKFKNDLLASYRGLQKGNTVCDIDIILQNTRIEVPPNFILDKKGSLSLDVTDDEVTDFMEKLVLAVNQPNENTLRTILANEMGENMNLRDGQILFNRLLERMLDWVGETRSRFLQPDDIKEIRQTVKGDFARPGLIGYSTIYKLKFEKYYTFNDEVEVVKKVKNVLKDTETQFVTIFYKTHLLSAMKISQAIKNTKVDENIFIDLKFLCELEGSATCPKEALRSDAYNNLIIDIDPTTNLNNAKQTLKFYYEIWKNKPMKNIVLMISHEQQDVAEKMIQELFQQLRIAPERHTVLVDDNNNLVDLTDESQDKLLEVSKVVFQGKVIALNSLVKIIKNNDNTNVYIERDILAKLICNERIEISKEPTDDNYNKVQKYFVDRLFHRCIKIDDNVAKDKSGFSVLSDGQVRKADLGRNQEIILISDDENQFNKLSKVHNNRVIHWLKPKYDYFCESNGEQSHTRDIIVLPNIRATDTDIRTKRIIILISGEETDFIELRERYSDKVIYWVGKNGGFSLRGYYNVGKKTASFDEKKEIVVVSSDHQNCESALLACRVMIVIARNDLDVELYNDLQERYNYKLIYFIKHTSALFWQQSHGSIETLREHIVHTKCTQAHTSKQIMASSEKVVIIAAEPGMGKSTLLTHLALNTEAGAGLQSPWVVKVHLRSYLTQLQQLSLDHDKSEAITFIYNTVFGFLNEPHVKEIIQIIVTNTLHVEININLDSVSTTEYNKMLNDILELQLFTYCYNSGKVVVYFDGFDEISSDCKTVVLDVLETLKRSRVQKIWVTTRPYNIQCELENRLCSFAYQIVPLDEDEQISMLNTFWEKKIDRVIAQERTKFFADKSWERLFQHVDSGESNMSTFKSVPLNLIMIATVYEEKFKEFCLSNDKKILDNLTKNFTLSGIYNSFIQAKLKMAYVEETGGNISSSRAMQNARERSLEDHRYLAFYELFAEGDLELVLPAEKRTATRNLIESIVDGTERTGLIDRVESGRPRFIHRTFAEHLVADQLLRMMEPSDEIFNTEACKFLYGILTRPDSQAWVLFKFLNFGLITNCEHGDAGELQAALNGNFADKSEPYDTVVPSAAYEGVTPEPSNYFGNVDDDQEFFPSDIDYLEPVDYYGRSPLHLICCSRLQADVSPYFENVNFSVNRKDRLFGWTPLHYAIVSFGYFPCFRDEGANCNCVCCGSERGLSSRDMHGRTPLMLAIQLGRTEVLRALRPHHDLNIRDNRQKTALHYAVEYTGDRAIVSELLNAHVRLNKHHNDYNLFARDDTGKTPLDIIFEKKNLSAWLQVDQAVLLMSKRMASTWKTIIAGIINKVDNDFKVQLLCTDIKNAVYFIGNSLIDVNTQDSEGRTALHHLSERNIVSSELYQYIIFKSCNVNIEDRSGKTPLHYALHDNDTMHYLLEYGAHYDALAIDCLDLSPDHLLAVIDRLFNSVKESETDKVKSIIEGYSVTGEAAIIVNARSKDEGKSPLDYAAQTGCTAIIHHIKSHGAWRFSVQYNEVNQEMIKSTLFEYLQKEHDSKPDFNPEARRCIDGIYNKFGIV